MLEVIRPGPQRLAVPADVARELGIDEAEAAALVDRASRGISQWCHRSFGIETVAETEMVGQWSGAIFCSRWPIVRVESILAGHHLLPTTAYEVDPENGAIYYLIDHNGTGYPAWPRTEISITYTGGYLMPGHSRRNLPRDLEAACLALAAIIHRAGGAPMQLMPRQVQHMLAAYRRPQP